MTKTAISKKVQIESKNNANVLAYYSSMKAEDVDKILSSFGSIEWRDFSDSSKGKYPEFTGLTFSMVSNLPSDIIKDAVLLLMSHQMKGKSALKHELAKVAYYSSSNPNTPKAEKTKGTKGRYTVDEIQTLINMGILTKEDAKKMIMGGA